MEYDHWGAEWMAQMELADLDRYQRSILKTSSYCDSMDDRRRSMADEDANMDQETINEVLLQFRDETKSEMAEMKAEMAEMKAQLSVIISILQDTSNGEEATPISPTHRAANEIDVLAGQFPTTIHGSCIDSESVQEESIQSLEENIIEPPAQNMFDEMPSPLPIAPNNARRVFAEMPEPNLEENLVSIEVPKAAHYLLDNRPTLFPVNSDEGLYGNMDSLSPCPYIIESSSSVNGSSWISGLITNISKVSIQDLSYGYDVLGVTATNSPALPKLGFNPQVFDPGTLYLLIFCAQPMPISVNSTTHLHKAWVKVVTLRVDVNLSPVVMRDDAQHVFHEMSLPIRTEHKGFGNQLNENESQLHCVSLVIFQLASNHRHEYIDKPASTLFDNMSKQYSSKQEAGSSAVALWIAKVMSCWNLFSNGWADRVNLASNSSTWLCILSPLKANFTWDPGTCAISAYILEDKDVFKRVGRWIVLMEHRTELTVTVPILMNHGEDHPRAITLQQAMDMAYAFARSFQLGFSTKDSETIKEESILSFSLQTLYPRYGILFSIQLIGIESNAGIKFVFRYLLVNSLKDLHSPVIYIFNDGVASLNFKWRFHHLFALILFQEYKVRNLKKIGVAMRILKYFGLDRHSQYSLWSIFGLVRTSIVLPSWGTVESEVAEYIEFEVKGSVHQLLNEDMYAIQVFDPGGSSGFHMVWCSSETIDDKQDFDFGLGQHNACSFSAVFRLKVSLNIATMLRSVSSIVTKLAQFNVLLSNVCIKLNAYKLLWRKFMATILLLVEVLSELLGDRVLIHLVALADGDYNIQIFVVSIMVKSGSNARNSALLIDSGMNTFGNDMGHNSVVSAVNFNEYSTGYDCVVCVWGCRSHNIEPALTSISSLSLLFSFFLWKER